MEDEISDEKGGAGKGGGGGAGGGAGEADDYEDDFTDSPLTTSNEVNTTPEQIDDEVANDSYSDDFDHGEE